jgi:two-component system, LytTR family, response regulator
MKVLVVQSPNERKNRVPDFSEPHLRNKLFRVSSVDEAILSIKKITPGLVIVDVEIENGNGFKVFEETTDVTYDKIVLTETSAHVVKSIRFDVSQYLLKPLQAEEIHNAVVSMLFKQKKNSIQQMFKDRFGNCGFVRLTDVFVPAEDHFKLIKANELIWIQDMGEYRLLQFTNGNLLYSTATCARLGLLLKGHGFERPSEEVLINPLLVTKIQADESGTSALMCDGQRFLISYQIESRIRRWRSQDDIRPPLAV